MAARAKRAGAAAFSLNGQSVLIYGFGAIARRLIGNSLRPLELRCLGSASRSARGDESVPMLTEHGSRRADWVSSTMSLNILPANDSTAAVSSTRRDWAAAKPGARFYNIGRGSDGRAGRVCSARCASARLGAAYLDVTDPEPLPADHPFWSAPNCYVTPHIGGTHSNEDVRLAQHFVSNLRAFETGQPLTDRVI